MRLWEFGSIRKFAVPYVMVACCGFSSSVFATDQQACGVNQRPEWIRPVPPSVHYVKEGNRFSITLPFAQDPEGDPISYELLNSPLASHFDPVTHQFDWTPPAASTNGWVNSSTGEPQDFVIYLDAIDPCASRVRFEVRFAIEDTPATPYSAVQPLMQNAQLFFPVMANGIPLSEYGREMLPYIKNLGFNTVSTQAIGRSVDQQFPNAGAARTQALAELAALAKLYLDTAQQAGLKVILQVHQSAVLALPEIRDHPSLLAIALPCDERDYSFYSALYPTSPQVTDPTCSDQFFATTVQAIRAATPELKIYANYTALFSSVARPYQYRDEATSARYRQEWANLDLVGFDYYLQNGAAEPDVAQPTTILGGIVEEAQTLSGGKPIIPIIEATKYSLLQPAAEQAHPIAAFDIMRQLYAVASANASGVGFYAANDWALPSNAGTVYRAWDIAPVLEGEQGFPKILGTFLGGIQIQQAEGSSPELSAFPVKVRSTTKLEDDFEMRQVEWDVPNPNFSSPRRIVCSMQSVDSDCEGIIGKFFLGATSEGYIRALAIGADGRSALTFFHLTGSDVDFCPANDLKLRPGICGCADSDSDVNDNGQPDCLDPSISVSPPAGAMSLSLSAKKLLVSVREWSGVSYEVQILSSSGRVLKRVRATSNVFQFALKGLSPGSYKASYRLIVNSKTGVATSYSIPRTFSLRKTKGSRYRLRVAN